MSDEEKSVDRWENEGGRNRKRKWISAQASKLMSPQVQRAARTWLLPVTLLVVSPLIIGSAWKKWRKR